MLRRWRDCGPATLVPAEAAVAGSAGTGVTGPQSRKGVKENARWRPSGVPAAPTGWKIRCLVYTRRRFSLQRCAVTGQRAWSGRDVDRRTTECSAAPGSAWWPVPASRAASVSSSGSGRIPAGRRPPWRRAGCRCGRAQGGDDFRQGLAAGIDPAGFQAASAISLARGVDARGNARQLARTTCRRQPWFPPRPVSCTTTTVRCACWRTMRGARRARCLRRFVPGRPAHRALPKPYRRHPAAAPAGRAGVKSRLTRTARVQQHLGCHRTGCSGGVRRWRAASAATLLMR